MFRFTIRDVLWVMVVVGLGMGWSLSYVNWTSRQAEWDERVRQTNQAIAWEKTVSQVYWDKYVEAVRERVNAEAGPN
jgi:hypothetical protein